MKTGRGTGRTPCGVGTPDTGRTRCTPRRPCTPRAAPAAAAAALADAGCTRRAWLRGLALLPPALASVAAARDAAAAEPAADVVPPARVGQLALVMGAAQMRLDDEQGWEPAEANTPVTTGTALATERLSRMELRIGSTALRLAPMTRCAATAIDDTAVAFELVHGRLSLRVRALAAGERIELSAGRVRLQVLAPGTYRLTHAERPGRLHVHVLAGQARLLAGTQQTAMDAGRVALADTQAGAVLDQRASDERVPLDEFADQRDRQSERSAALAHLPAEMTGAESLDGHGTWRHEPGYGPVWYPSRVSADWAPYRQGRWRWIAPWGWTWVDDAPWGFAPFHYGRWLFQGGRWGWVPGRTAAVALGTRPVYAPALVGFYGDEGGDAEWTPVAGAPAVVGWYPLAPGEVYWPAYSSDPGYVRALNAAHVVDGAALHTAPGLQAAGPVHRYTRTAFAATAMPLVAFQAMQPVAPQQVALPPAALARAPLGARRRPPRRVIAAVRRALGR